MKVARIHPDAILPVQGSKLAAGFDLHSVERVEVKKGTTELLPTGLVLAIPPGWEGQVRCRSGLGKKGLILPNGVGTIDADYRGELMVLAHWIGEGDSFVVEKGERIGQNESQKFDLLKSNAKRWMIPNAAQVDLAVRVDSR